MIGTQNYIMVIVVESRTVEQNKKSNDYDKKFDNESKEAYTLFLRKNKNNEYEVKVIKVSKEKTKL